MEDLYDNIADNIKDNYRRRYSNDYDVQAAPDDLNHAVNPHIPMLLNAHNNGTLDPNMFEDYYNNHIRNALNARRSIIRRKTQRKNNARQNIYDVHNPQDLDGTNMRPLIQPYQIELPIINDQLNGLNVLGIASEIHGNGLLKFSKRGRLKKKLKN